MLMRPDMVVPEPEFPECCTERIEGRYFQPIHFPLKRAEQTLNPSILPRATRITLLLADTRRLLYSVSTPIQN